MGAIKHKSPSSPGPLAALALICLVSSLAGAAAADPASPKETFASLRVWNFELLKQQPALMNVEAAVLGDCRAKAPSSVNVLEYCSCARALVMNMWLSGADPAMVQRVKAYAIDPKSADAADFLKYQGPELYKPFCEAAVGAG